MSADVEVYRFELNGEVRRFTSADAALEYAGETYEPLDGLHRDDLEQTGESARSSLVVEMPATAFPASLFAGGVPDGVVLLRLMQRSSGAWRMIWRGRVLSCEYQGIFARLQCEPWFTSLKAPGLRRMFTPSCPHDFCDWHCGLDPTDWTVTDRVAAVDGTWLHLPRAGEMAEGSLCGGVLRFGGAAREVLGHAGADLELMRALSGLKAGEYVSVLAGCDKSTATCAARGNLANHGGWPNIPHKDPTTGDPVL